MSLENIDLNLSINSLDKKIIDLNFEKKKLNLLNIINISNDKILVKKVNYKNLFKEEKNEILEEEFLDSFFSNKNEDEIILNNFKDFKNNYEFQCNSNILNNNKDNSVFKKNKYSEYDLKLFFKNCIICYNNFKNKDNIMEIMSCKHYFHFKCLSKWIITKEEDSCPICK